MIDDLNNLNLGDLLKKAQSFQGQVRQLQEELTRKTVTADAGAGMVQATVNGRLELVKLKIDKTKINTEDTEMLEDVILAAVKAAQTRAAEMMKQEMQRMAGQMGLPPGMLP